jgi:hypothetical protein
MIRYVSLNSNHIERSFKYKFLSLFPSYFSLSLAPFRSLRNLYRIFPPGYFTSAAIISQLLEVLVKEIKVGKGIQERTKRGKDEDTKEDIPDEIQRAFPTNNTKLLFLNLQD